jgi:hypothetical protein
MNAIATALGCTLSISTHNGGIEYFHIQASSANSRAILATYFSQFPLFGSKYLNYQDWLACHELIKRKLHITKEGRDKALKLKAGMNTKRKSYN